jgi:RNA polymerase sigma-70 factor (ECF subfamily)
MHAIDYRVLPPAPSFADIFCIHYPSLARVALRLCGRDRSAAEDLVQDTFERALLCRAQFRPGSNAYGWLVTILRRLFIDAHRRARRLPTFEPVEKNEHLLSVSIDDEPAPEWTNVAPEQIGPALAALPEEFRAVYELHVVEGLSYKEIADRLGIKAATVGSRLTRARKRMRLALVGC